MAPLSPSRAGELLDTYLAEKNSRYFAIQRHNDKAVIGYTFLAKISQRHRIAREFGIVIDETCWGRGYGSDATRLLLTYGFQQLKLHRIELLVLDDNDRARRMYRNLGFVDEGIRREACLIDGEWHDVIMMGLLETEWNAHTLPQAGR
jgi:RimJ/RimL family protein N-acetyltransferase